MNLRAHARRLEEVTGKSPSPAPEFIGALALPVALFGGLALSFSRVGAFSVAAIWFLILFGLYRWVDAENPWLPALGTVLIGGVLLFGELLVALVVLKNAGAYLLLAFVLTTVAIVVEYRLLLARR